MIKIFNTFISIWLISLLLIQSELFSQNELKKDIQDIKERVIRLEEGQKNLEKRLDAVEASMNKRIDDLRSDMTSRLDALMLWMQILSGVLALLFASIFGTLLVIWKKVITVEVNVAQQMKIISEQLNLLKTKTV